MNNVTILPISAHATKLIVKRYDYGDIVPMDELYKMLEVEMPKGRITSKEHQVITFKRLDLVEDVKKRLLEEHSILFKNIRSEGYALVTPEEQSSVVLDHMDSKIKKHLIKAIAGITNIRHDLLTEQQRQEHLRATGRVTGIGIMLHRERKSFAYAAKKIEQD